MSRKGPWPVKLVFRASEKALNITFDDGKSFSIPFEFLRVESPSAEVQGHGPGQKKTITGKHDIQITQADRVGQYAVRLHFDDGHNSGIYSWALLREMGEHLTA